MEKDIKKHDLRDDVKAPKVSVPDEALDHKPATTVSDSGQLATPDKGAVVGQTTHM